MCVRADLLFRDRCLFVFHLSIMEFFGMPLGFDGPVPFAGRFGCDFINDYDRKLDLGLKFILI